ncbi:MAG: thioredoxin family protein [Archaeoglobales archaeon]|nr:thioredoxin family protein [Archaeoglobales archaeon]
MDVKVVGPGCARCKTTLELVKKVVEREKINAKVEYVTDMKREVELGIMATPAVIVDGKIVVQGRIPSESEIVKALKK